VAATRPRRRISRGDVSRRRSAGPRERVGGISPAGGDGDATARVREAPLRRHARRGAARGAELRVRPAVAEDAAIPAEVRRRAHMSLMNRGAAAAATWIRRRGRGATLPSIRVRRFGFVCGDLPSEYPRGTPRRGRDPPTTAAPRQNTSPVRLVETGARPQVLRPRDLRGAAEQLRRLRRVLRLGRTAAAPVGNLDADGEGARGDARPGRHLGDLG